LARDYQRARAWWARAAIQADPESEQLTAIMKSHADALLEHSRWQEAAAVSEMLAALFAGTDYQWANPLMLMRQRLQADMCRALALLGENRKLSLEILDQCHRIFANDGSLADFFFPSLRQVGLIREHDKWFLDSWNRMQDVIKAYPNSDNTRNTAAWFAARAVRKLDEAEAHSRAALAASPNQSAYLDTMAEIYFARGLRDQALEWSAKAVNASPEDSMLRRQHARFLSDPLPK
jgi:tetratricopeptide (TPR) repeat protein